jgi:hypothetical protein
MEGEPFPVLVGNAGPHKETVKALVIWPKGHLEDVLTGVLQPQFSPAHDLCMVRVLEQMAALLTPDQLSYLKAPAGRVIKLPSANGNDYFHFRERGGFVAADGLRIHVPPACPHTSRAKPAPAPCGRVR